MTESMEFDVVIVGAGPAGLSAAIRLRQLAQEAGKELSVCVLEKGSEVGAHLLAGAVLEPRALNELIPDWQEKGAPLNTPVTQDKFVLLGSWGVSAPLPVPPPMRNHGNYVISLGNFCRWLASQAELLGVQIFPGFPARDVLINKEGQVMGVSTAEFGRAADGSEKEGFQPSMEIKARYTLLGEGCRGHITRQLEERYQLRQQADPQTYGLGLKELWKIDPEKHQPGLVMHTVGWPLDGKTYGGSFLYHLEDHQVAVGFVIGLDYTNPHLNPYREFQEFKTHKAIRDTFAGGKRIAYGARALNEGGLQSLPMLTFPGGALIGCGAGFLNVPKIKGIHTAMKSGMLAAEAIIEGDLERYEEKFEASWLYDELYKSRNIRPAFHKGLFVGMTYAALDTYLLRGNAPWTFQNRADHMMLQPADTCETPPYSKPDGELTFDLMSSVFISNTNHTENQPCHLALKDPNIPLEVNYQVFFGPEARYCPAGVYEFSEDDLGNIHFQIHAQNCLHCKTCDIKDPTQNIVWVPPEGGGGPNYPNM